MEVAVATGQFRAAEAQAARDSSFAEAYEAYYTRVFAFIYSRVQSVDLARDLVSEVFERAYVNSHTLRDPAAYRAWLFMIAKNVIAGHFRRTKREARGADRVKEDLRCFDNHVDPDESLIRNERVGRLIEHLRSLGRRDQELLSLKFDAELTHTEIARVTGLSSINVRVSIFRALKRLRARMEKDEVEAHRP